MADLASLISEENTESVFQEKPGSFNFKNRLEIQFQEQNGSLNSRTI